MMHRNWLRVVGFSLALVGCTTEQALVAPRELSVKQNRGVTPQRNFSGSISGTVTFFQPDNWITYKTQEIPLRAQLESGKMKVDESVTQAMLGSIYIAGQGKTLHNTSAPVTAQAQPVQLAAYTSSNPEQDLIDWRNANATSPGAEDDFLETPPWGDLTGSTYTEDVSSEQNGTAMMQLVVEPISTSNPNGQIKMYLNGQMMGQINPQYQYMASDGGYALQVENGTSYRYSGSATATGSRNITMQQPTRYEMPRQVQPLVAFRCVRMSTFAGSRRASTRFDAADDSKRSGRLV